MAYNTQRKKKKKLSNCISSLLRHTIALNSRHWLLTIISGQALNILNIQAKVKKPYKKFAPLIITYILYLTKGNFYMFVKFSLTFYFLIFNTISYLRLYSITLIW